MTLYLILKYLHVMGASVLLGTGADIAFFMLMAHLSEQAQIVAGVARIVVVADFMFTATAVSPLCAMQRPSLVGRIGGSGRACAAWASMLR
jgi:uncharacterized membrane protein